MTKYTPKPGDYGLSIIGGPLGKAIKIAQAITGDWSRYTHAFIVLDDGTIMQAMPSGAEIVPLAPLLEKDVVFSRWDLTDEERAAIVENARALEGTPYGFLDYVALALAHFGIRPERLMKFVRTDSHMICSQLVDYCYRKAGVQLFDDDRLPCDVTPGDLTYTLYGTKEI